MKRIIILSLICTVLALAIDARVIRPIRPRPGQDQPGKPPKLHSDNTLIILYDGKSGKKSLMKAVKKYFGEEVKTQCTIKEKEVTDAE